MESQTEEMLKKILTMETPLALLVNLIVIAIIPGMGEELIFRGILQKNYIKPSAILMWPLSLHPYYLARSTFNLKDFYQDFSGPDIRFDLLLDR